MFSVPDWGKDEDHHQGGPADPINNKKKKKKGKGEKVRTELIKKWAGLINSPSMSQNLMGRPDETSEDPPGEKKNNKKKKKKKKKKEKKKNESPAALSRSGSVGSLLKKGIKFANLEDFAQFMGEKTSSLKRKREPSGDQPEEEDKKRRKLEGHSNPGFDVDKLKDLLNTSSSSLSTPSPSAAAAKLKSSRFRYLNELLYTQPGAKSFKMFKQDTQAFHTYHEGYMKQAEKWPNDPLQNIITAIMKR